MNINYSTAQFLTVKNVAFISAPSLTLFHCMFGNQEGKKMYFHRPKLYSKSSKSKMTKGVVHKLRNALFTVF